MTEPELLPCPHTKLEYLKDPIEPGWYCCLCGNYWEPPGLGASAPGLDREKFDDAQTLAAYWLMADSENRRKMWESDIKKICEALLTFSAPAASRGADRDFTPEEALAEAHKRWGGKNAVSVECYLSRWDEMPPGARKYKVSGIYKNQEFEGDSFKAAFAAADRAEKENK